MQSVLVPSSHLNFIPVLSKQQQDIFANRKSNLDVQKYKNGKVLYLSYVEAKSASKQSNRYKMFIEQFKGLDYLNKIIKISSLKYYRDVKPLLIGGDADGGIKDDTRFKTVEIGQIVRQLEDIAQNKVQIRQAKAQQKRVLFGQKQQPIQPQTQIIVKHNVLTPQQPLTENRYFKKQEVSRNIKKQLFPATKNKQPSNKQSQKTQQVKISNDSKVQDKKSPEYRQKQRPTYKQKIKELLQAKQKQQQLQIKINQGGVKNKMNKSQVVRKNPTIQAIQQQQQPINPIQISDRDSETKSFLKLYKVQVSRNRPGLYTDRIMSKNSSGQSGLNRSFGKSTKLSNLRQSWGSAYEKEKSESQKMKQKPFTTHKKQESMLQTKTISKSVKPTTQKIQKKMSKKQVINQPSLVETICKKLFQCLKSLNIIRGQVQNTRQNQRKGNQQNQSMLKKPVNMNYSTQPTRSVTMNTSKNYKNN